MSVLSSLDTSQYTTPFTAALEINTYQSLQKIDDAKLETPNVAATDKETPKVDLNNYYSNVQPGNLGNADVTSVQSGVAQASQNLSNAVTLAVEHGMDPQDAINIQKAKVAYETSMQASQTSTFQLTVE